MALRLIALALVISVLGLGLYEWHVHAGRPTEPDPAQATSPEAAGAPEATSQEPAVPLPGESPPPEIAAPPPQADPGLAWTVPSRWKQEPDRPMRLATYAVPAAGGDPRGGECAVYYFGPGQGGSAADNIARWAGQFEDAELGDHDTRVVHGVHMTRVTIRGTYLAPAGPTMESQGSFPNYGLMGAIVDGPRGNVYFKLTAPAKTLDAARKDLDGLLGSIRRR